MVFMLLLLVASMSSCPAPCCVVVDFICASGRPWFGLYALGKKQRERVL